MSPSSIVITIRFFTIKYVICTCLSVFIGCRDELVNQRTNANGTEDQNSVVPYVLGSKIVINDPQSGSGQSQKSFPLVLIDPAKICNDISFYNGKGELETGTRDCSLGSSDPNFKPEFIKSGVQIADIIGTALPLTGDCSQDGQTSCVTTTSFPAALKAGAADKIIAGQTLAGISGNVIIPEEGKVLSGSTYGVSGTSLNGTLIVPSTSNVLTGTGSYGDPQAALTPSLSYDFPDAANVRASDTVNGATGTIADCASDAAIGCVTNNSYKAADMSNVSAANIRTGVTIAGQAGSYPSSSYPLPSASATADLTSATFTAKIKSSTSFEYWSSDGTYHSDAGDSDITAANILAGVSIFGTTGIAPAPDCQHTSQGACEADNACRWTGSCEVNPWNIRTGISLAGKTGSAKVNCRNLIQNSIYNTDLMPPGTGSDTSGTSSDWWDTIDNFSNNGGFPTQLPSGWTSDHACEIELWSDLTSDGACDSDADDCLMRDNVTGLIWSESYPVTATAPATTQVDWSQAVQHCHDLSFGGRSDWRLPTQMEMLTLYTHGIRRVGFKGGTTNQGGDSLNNNSYFIADVDVAFWTATSSSTDRSYAYYVYTNTGYSDRTPKTNLLRKLLCVTE